MNSLLRYTRNSLDELLVGAPTLFDSQSCGGAVYVYNNEDLVS